MSRTYETIFLALALTTLAALGGAAWGDVTRRNLETAYNSETNARLRYEAFAAKAEEEGYPGLARTFRALAYSESVHAANHAAALSEMGVKIGPTDTRYVVKSTRENLAAAVKMEGRESAKVYPGYLIQAASDGNERAGASFKGALASERTHVKLLEKYMKEGADWARRLMVLVCRTCGYTSEDAGLKTCPFCSHPREEFAEY